MKQLLQHTIYNAFSGRNKTAVIKLTDTINVRYKNNSGNNIKSNRIKSSAILYSF